jgi:hypothetical protein
MVARMTGVKQDVQSFEWFDPSKQLYKKMRSAITYLTLVTFVYTLFFILLVTSGFSNWTTLTPSVVNLYGGIGILCPLSGVVCLFSRFSKKVRMTETSMCRRNSSYYASWC